MAMAYAIKSSTCRLLKAARLTPASLTRWQKRPASSTAMDATDGLDDPQCQVYEMALNFAKKEMAPHRQKWDHEGIFPVDVMRMGAELGFGAIYCSDEYGGTGLSRLEGSIIFEALSQGSGSDAMALLTTAKKDGDSYILNGTKSFISGAGHSDLYLIMARTGGQGSKGISCFAVEKNFPGLSFGQLEQKIGWCTQPTRQVIMEDCRVPAESMIGNEGQGFHIAMKGINGGRLNVASCSLGAAHASIEAAVEHMKVRSQFNTLLKDFQYLQFRMAEMVTKLVAARLLIRHAALALDNDSPSAKTMCAMAKMYGTEECTQICSDAMQMFGGYGMLKDYAPQQFYRDSRVHMVIEGTNEIMRMLIARDLFQD